MKPFFVSILALLLIVTSGFGAEVRRTSANLPYRFPQMDAFGNVWMIYNGGRLMQQGNMPFCSDSANLSVNGQGVPPQNQAIAIENGEAVIENLRLSQFTVTRRFFQAEDGSIRITEILRNTRGQEAVANVAIAFNANFGVQSTRLLSDPRNSGKTLGLLVTDGQNRSMISVFAGQGAKLTPSINAQANNNVVQTAFELKVPGNKEVAIVHFHQTLPSADDAEKVFASMRDPRALAALPAELRRIVANYPTGAGMFDDLQILRGTTTDVLELTNGDQLRGDLLNRHWEVQASFGKVQIPAEQVISMIVAGGMSPRQLVITRDGEIIGGKLAADAIELQISSGQKVSIPVSQVSRIGVRAGTESPAAPAKPMVQLRTGDRLAISPPADPLHVVTRFGSLSLPSDSIASVDLQPPDSPVHSITLTDGSRFSGLVAADAMGFALLRGGSLEVPTALVRRLTFAPENDVEPVAVMRLTGDDSLAAQLPVTLKLLTSYGEVEIKGAEVKRIARTKESIDDIQVQLWDDSTLTGRLAQPFIECTLGGKAVARVPLAAIEQYTSTSPSPAAGIVERIKALVSELNADDWKRREKAEAELVTMGSIILPTLEQVRPQQPPEAQQRIDTIVRRLRDGASATSTIRIPNRLVPQ